MPQANWIITLNFILFSSAKRGRLLWSQFDSKDHLLASFLVINSVLVSWLEMQIDWQIFFFFSFIALRLEAYVNLGFLPKTSIFLGYNSSFW